VPNEYEISRTLDIYMSKCKSNMDVEVLIWGSYRGTTPEIYGADA
jgi:hypothetical protein